MKDRKYPTTAGGMRRLAEAACRQGYGIATLAMKLTPAQFRKFAHSFVFDDQDDSNAYVTVRMFRDRCELALATAKTVSGRRTDIIENDVIFAIVDEVWGELHHACCCLWLTSLILMTSSRNRPLIHRMQTKPM